MSVAKQIAVARGILFLAVLTVLASSGSAAQTPDADPVAVSLYMESLCPGCQQLFASQLYPTWAKLNSTGILQVDVIPYGNAHEQQKGNKWIFTCQHGVNECIGNQFETCAIKLLAGPPQWLPYLHCIELKLAAGSSDVPQVAKDCASQLNVTNFDAISTCAVSAQGNAWQHEMAQRTDALNPPHQYVPWVTVNGVHTDAIQSQAETNLLKLVCTTYTGTRPSQCGQVTDGPVHRCPRQ